MAVVSSQMQHGKQNANAYFKCKRTPMLNFITQEHVGPYDPSTPNGISSFSVRIAYYARVDFFSIAIFLSTSPFPSSRSHWKEMD